MRSRDKPGARRRALLAFGESLNDTKAIATLLAGLRKDLPRASCRVRPIMLSRSAEEKKRRTVAEEIAGIVRAEIAKGNDVHAVIAHRDLDKIEQDETVSCNNPDGSSGHSREIEREITTALRDACVSSKVTAIVTAFETEAWWFMWPEAVAAHRPSWRKLPDRTGKRVDRIIDAKETLRSELRPAGGRHKVPDYSETDSPLIAAKISELGLVERPKGVSIAFQRFRETAKKL